MESENRIESLRRLFKENNLHSDDAFKHPKLGYVLIRRSGVEKIQMRNKISVAFEPIHISHDFVVIKAIGTATLKDGTEALVESFGEASKSNTTNSYPVAVSEARALSRVVLKLAGFYQLGVYSEMEFDVKPQENVRSYGNGVA